MIFPTIKYIPKGKLADPAKVSKMGEGAGDKFPTLKFIGKINKSKTGKDPVKQTPPERSKSVNGEDVSQNPGQYGQFNQIEVESTPATQGVNELQNIPKPNLSQTGVGQNLYPQIQDETRQQTGTPINPTDKMAGTVDQYNELPALKLLKDNLFMTEALKQPVQTGIDAISDVGEGNTSKGFQKGVLSLAELGSIPFTSLDALVKQIPDVGEDISGISQLPFVIMGETGKDANKNIREFLGFKLQDKEQEVLADEIAGVLAQFIIPAGIGKGFSLTKNGFKKLTEIKGIVESIPEPIRTAENIRALLPEGVRERRIVDPEGNVTTEKVPTGDLTKPRQDIIDSQRNIETNPRFTEDAPRITNQDAGIFDKGVEDNSFNIVDKGVKPDLKAQTFKEKTIPKLQDLVKRSKTKKDFIEFVQREFPYNNVEVANKLHDYGYVREKGTSDNVFKSLDEYFDYNKKEEVKTTTDKFLDDFNPTELEKERAKDFLEIKKQGNLNLNSVEGTQSLKPQEVRKGLNDIEKGDFSTPEAKFVTDKINKAYETGIENNATRQDPRKTKLSADELKGIQIPKELNGINESLSKFGWKAEEKGNAYEVFNANNKKVATITKKGDRYTVTDNTGAKLLTGNNEIGKGISKVAKDYFYASEKPVETTKSKPTFEQYLDAIKKELKVGDTGGTAFEESWRKQYEKTYGKDIEGSKKIIKDALSNKNLDFMGLSKLSDITKPEVLKAVKDVAKYHLENGAKSFKDFARKMVKDAGAWIKPHLRKLWEETKKIFTGERSLVESNTLSMGIPKFNDKMSEPGVTREVKVENPKGTEKSDFTPNEKTIHGDIKREIREYLKTDLELMRELRRQKITDTKALDGGVKYGVKIAEELGGINYIKNLKEGSVFPIEQHLGIVGFATKNLKDALRNKELPLVDRLEAFYGYYKAEAISGELGRSLRGRQLIPRLPIEDIKGIAKDLIDSPDVPQEMKKQVEVMTEEIIKNPNAIKEPNWYDKARYVLYNAMLSRPLTHGRNIFGNASHLMFEMLQNPNAGTLKGLKRGAQNIPQALKKVWNEGGDVSKFTEGVYEPKNKTLRNIMPTTLLKFEDIVFKELAKGMATEWQGKQLAKEKGISVKTAISSIEAVMDGKSLKGTEAMERISKAVDEIEEYAKFVTFQKDLGPIGQKFQNWIKSIPGSELIVPFIRTPANILKVGLQPLKVLKYASPEYRAKFREMSPLMKRQELTRITAGAVAYFTLYELMSQGVIDITGQGADDKSKKDFMESQGWKPNSIKIGSRYYSYQNVNPFNVGLALIGNYSDGLKYNYKPKDDKLNPVQKLSKTLAGFVQTTTDQSFLRGLSELSKWQEDENPYYLEGFVNALIPNVLSVTKDAQGDETAYENKTLGEKINSKVGGKNRPRINVFGDIEENSGTGLPFTIIPPKIGSPEKTDELSKILLESNTTISYPKKFIKPNGEEVTDEELYNYTKETGQKIKQKLLDNMSVLKEMSPGEIDSEVDRVVTSIRNKVKEDMFGERKTEKRKYRITLDK